METITIIAIASIAFAVLNLILFFKVWGMTNNVERIANGTNSGTTLSEEVATSTTKPLPNKAEDEVSAAPLLWAFALCVAFFVILKLCL